ncbi:hypothetical protein P280DRAFT_514087 [Massarina eburnea CBS 473.64]|uniref:polynucleotide adenylyltransferase n=1 Tax=Massarina eburnea CBS 473.64 TaxID=1395130 RepID=A0A6A6S9R6_9PLEO|nr:hypothetical protein P280DRAFT_514087 [Massarina eburnea CBS 473.64]
MADSYRPNQQRPARGGRSLADRITFGGQNSGGHRPGNANDHETFTFTSGHRAPQFPSGPAGDRARRRPPRGGAAGQFNDRNPRRGGDSYQTGGRNGAGASRRGNFRRKEAPHERALLQSRDDTTEQSFVRTGSNKFNLDNISDQDSDMSTSDDSGSEGKAKAARTESNARADGDSVPKWCNPDPYTALPPPETGNKRIDVVKLIRKAKNENDEKNNGNNAVAANDDFISFGDDVVEAPLNRLPPPPGMGPSAAGSRAKRSADDVGLSYMSQSGGRKRVRDEPDVQDIALVADLVVKAWKPTGHQNVPWLSANSNQHVRDNAAKWLHNEILDFYDYVVATEHEHRLRLDLIDRVQKVMTKSQFPEAPGSIYCFGSFHSTLYLPGADMDLVYISDLHYRGGPQSISPSANRLRKIGQKLGQQGVADEIQVIGRAKVPIIKFKDRLTGIPVDICIENRSGLDAQYYFQKWKHEHQDMIYLVALVKQFLRMRDLNEVSTQGLGGFAIICMVVNYLQRLQGSKASDTDEYHNVGDIFLGFLDYYGNQFNIATERLVMYEPYIVKKGSIGIDGRREKTDGLSIQDPGRPDNNISGGSAKATTVLRLFSGAHALLCERLDSIRNGTYSGNSILEPLFGGNYRQYKDHRLRLSKIR